MGQLVFNFSDAEKQSIKDILVDYSNKAKYQLSLEMFMEQWKNLVDDLRTEYLLSIDDYINDLDTREILQDIMNSCSDNKDFIEWVVEIDNHFLNLTTEVNRPLVPAVNNNPIGWWWYRIPKNRHEDFRDKTS